jgi:galactofuranosylgalactofuranosylrhamnosyl-N-acetylglucosaminyl-diphospho-decaprenol beta-1,5/1,6-galactofuranosyltransferase
LTDIAHSPVFEASDEIDPLVGRRVVQRTILRAEQELDIRPLYVSGLSNFSTGESTSRQSGSSEDEAHPESTTTEQEETAGQSDESISGYGTISGTVGAVVRPERRLTFGTYFNAFPASYWRRWTDFDSVRLVMTVSGTGTVIVYRSTSKGHIQRADTGQVDSGELRTLVFDLPLKPFIDGGWYWFDLEAGETALTLEEAVWAFETEHSTTGRLSIGITTFNRPEFCVDQLITLSEQPAILTALDEILVVDQGSQKVADHELYPQVAATLGSKLRLIEQGNLGGSGGFSRAMDEASKADTDYVLLLDDDVVCEPEGILRAIAFADLAKHPTIVGGQMFSLYDRSVLHAFGETVAKYRWFWGAAPNTVHGHNFAKKSLRSTQWLHRRIDVDYNGWWMCLIPTKIIREIGLSLPMFIKWDDAEFGLRAGEAGYATVTLPGVAVWHVPWHEKDDTIDWQAYFQASSPGQGADGSDRQDRPRKDDGRRGVAPGAAGPRHRPREPGGEHPACRPQVVAAVPVRLGAGLLCRRHRGGLVQARPGPLPLADEAVADVACAAGRRMAAPGRAIQVGASRPRLSGRLARDLRHLHGSGPVLAPSRGPCPAAIQWRRYAVVCPAITTGLATPTLPSRRGLTRSDVL